MTPLEVEGQNVDKLETKEQMEAPEVNHFELKPRIHTPTPLVTLQTLYDVLIEERAA